MNRTILVTGASRGIGKATALRLADSGFNVVVHCHSSADQAQSVAEQICALGCQARVLCFDVSDRTASRTAIEADIEANEAYYGVVCNAGIAKDAAFPAMAGADWDQVIQTNLNSFYNVLHPITMPMIRRRASGRIVTIASVSGIIGNRGQTNYGASKGGIIAASKSLAIELAKRKITVNCVAPGLIETEMVADVEMAQALSLIPMNRVGQVHEVASVINFLMSDEASYITRQVISVNGGLC